MLDAADLAILETYADRMNPTEKGLLEEIRERFDDAEDLATLRARVEELEEKLADKELELEEAKDRIETLETSVQDEENARLKSDHTAECATRALEELRALIRGVVA